MQRDGIIVADGSYKEGRSAAAIAIQPQQLSSPDIDDITEKNYSAVTMPGPAADQSSYRAELGGILTGIAFTNELVKEQGIPKADAPSIAIIKEH